MNFIKNNLASIGGGAAVLLLIGGYMLLSGGSPSNSLLTATPASQQASVQSQELLALLSSIEGVAFDKSIFTDSIFVSLTDSGVSLPAPVLGRRNPFAPVSAAEESGQPQSAPTPTDTP